MYSLMMNQSCAFVSISKNWNPLSINLGASLELIRCIRKHSHCSTAHASNSSKLGSLTVISEGISSLAVSIYQWQLYAWRIHLEAPTPPSTWLKLGNECHSFNGASAHTDYEVREYRIHCSTI